MLLLVIVCLTSTLIYVIEMKCSTLLIWGWQHNVIGNFSSVDILMTCTLCQCNIMTFLYNLIGAGARSPVYLCTSTILVSYKINIFSWQFPRLSVHYNDVFCDTLFLMLHRYRSISARFAHISLWAWLLTKISWNWYWVWVQAWLIAVT